jgi:hypothetical protein
MGRFTQNIMAPQNTAKNGPFLNKTKNWLGLAKSPEIENMDHPIHR